MYVDETLWKKIPLKIKNQLKYLQRIIEDYIQSLFQIWNEKRKFQCKNIFILIPLRDSFQIQLVSKTNIINCFNGKNFLKTIWYFPAYNVPVYFIFLIKKYNFLQKKNYVLYDKENLQIIKIIPDNFMNEMDVIPIGIITYNHFFLEEQLQLFESYVDQTDQFAKDGNYNEFPQTFQQTIKYDKLVRTKFFFGARYLWHATQTKNKEILHQAEGIRVVNNFFLKKRIIILKGCM